MNVINVCKAAVIFAALSVEMHFASATHIDLETLELKEIDGKKLIFKNTSKSLEQCLQGEKDNITGKRQYHLLDGEDNITVTKQEFISYLHSNNARAEMTLKGKGGVSKENVLVYPLGEKLTTADGMWVCVNPATFKSYDRKGKYEIDGKANASIQITQPTKEEVLENTVLNCYMCPELKAARALTR